MTDHFSIGKKGDYIKFSNESANTGGNMGREPKYARKITLIL